MEQDVTCLQNRRIDKWFQLLAYFTSMLKDCFCQMINILQKNNTQQSMWHGPIVFLPLRILEIFNLSLLSIRILNVCSTEDTKENEIKWQRKWIYTYILQREILQQDHLKIKHMPTLNLYMVLFLTPTICSWKCELNVRLWAAMNLSYAHSAHKPYRLSVFS